MLTFRWKCRIQGSWNTWDIFTGLDPRLSHVPKWRPRQRNWDRHCWARFFQKDNMNLKHWMYIFESAFEDLSFHSFLKTSDWDFQEKNGCSKYRIPYYRNITKHVNNANKKNLRVIKLTRIFQKLCLHLSNANFHAVCCIIKTWI